MESVASSPVAVLELLPEEASLVAEQRLSGAWASGVAAGVLSSCGSRAAEHRLRICDTRAQLLRSMWDLPRPGIEPISPALAGDCFTTEPPGKIPTLSITFASLSSNLWVAS